MSLTRPEPDRDNTLYGNDVAAHLALRWVYVG